MGLRGTPESSGSDDCAKASVGTPHLGKSFGEYNTVRLKLR